MLHPSAPAVSQPVAALRAAVSAVTDEVLPTDLGATLGADVSVLSTAIARLQIELGRRMSAWMTQDATADPVDVCVQSGIDASTARRLRRAETFSANHPALHAAWRSGEVTARQVGIVATGTRRLSAETAAGVIAALTPVLAGLTNEDTRTAVEAAVDIADPIDTQERDRDDYDNRYLSWTGIRGGLDIRGYLPGIDAGAFTAAISALAEDLRTEGDHLSVGQRRADALMALVVKASAHGLPTGGGLPAAVTLTVSAEEAERLLGQDPGTDRRDRRPGCTGRTVGGTGVGDADTRFALCCTAITPVHHHTPADRGSLADRVRRTPIEPLQVGRAVRLATAAQRRALQVRDGGCIVPGCHIGAAYIQPHHVRAWSMGGASNLNNYASLCWVHHRQVEHGHWEIVPTVAGSARPWRAVRRL